MRTRLGSGSTSTVAQTADQAAVVHIDALVVAAIIAIATQSPNQTIATLIRSMHQGGISQNSRQMFNNNWTMPERLSKPRFSSLSQG